MQTQNSEVARLFANMNAEYLVTKWGISGLCSGTSKYQCVTVRMERIGEYQQQQQLVGEDSLLMIAETLTKLPETPTRRDITSMLRRELGPVEDTDFLLDSIYEAWDTADRLRRRFGEQAARTILTASLQRKEIGEDEQETTRKRGEIDDSLS